MTAPNPNSPEVQKLLREAVRYTSVTLLAGFDPDDPESVLIHEVRRHPDGAPCAVLPDDRLAEALREFADRLDARHGPPGT